MTTADMDARDRNQGYERRMRIALQAIRDNQQWEIAYAALQELLEDPGGEFPWSSQDRP